MVLNSILIPRWGAVGAAVASSFSEMMVNLVQFIYVKRKIDISVSQKSLFQILISTLLIFVSTALIHRFMANAVTGILFSGVGIMAIYGVCYVRLLTSDDKKVNC